MGMAAILVMWPGPFIHLYKLFFLLPKEAPHKIWLWLAKRFRRRRCLNIVDDDDDDDNIDNDDNGRQSKGIL